MSKGVFAWMQRGFEVMAAGARTGLAGLLWQVALPGRLRRRVTAAAALPAWVAAVVAIGSLLLSGEIISYVSAVTHEFLEVMFARWEDVTRIPTGAAPVFLEVAIRHVRLHTIPLVVGGPAGLMAGVSVVAGVVALLESLNAVVLAPRAVGCGQKVTRVLRKTRKVLLALGGLWLLEWSIAGLVVFLAASAMALRAIEVMYIRISYTLLDDLTTLSLEACLAGLLLAWVVRLGRAAACLAPAPVRPVAARCSACGYLLAGVPAGTACSECGLAEPDLADRQRRESPWLQREAVGYAAALAGTVRGVLWRPGRFFAGIETLAEPREGLRLVNWNLGLAIAAWALAVPGIAAAMADPDDVYVAGRVVTAGLVALEISLASGLAGALLIALVTSVMGFAIGRVREEPAWPVAAHASCYLSVLLPRIAVVQAMWVTGLFTVEQVVRRGLWLHLARQWWTQTGVPWEVLLSLVFGWPTVLGVVWVVRTAVVCYRGVRFAGR